MGLEMAGLVMECEEEFGAIIVEESVDMAEIVTVGRLAAIIARQLGHPSTRDCPRVRVFFSLRTVVATQLAVQRATIKSLHHER